MGLRDAFRRNTTSLFFSMLVASGMVTYAVNRGDGPGDPLEDKVGQKTAENDFNALLGTLKTDFPHIYKKVKNDLNAHLLMTSPMFDMTRNQYSVDNVKELDAIFENTTAETVAEQTIAALEIFEGLEKRSYDDGFGFKTIAMGVRLYPSASHPRSKLVSKHLGKGVSYASIYSGRSQLTAAQARAISIAALEEKGGYLAVLNKSIEQAVNSADSDDIEEGDLHSDNMSPAYKAMLATMVFQCPDVLTRDTSKTFDALRTLCSKNADAFQQRDAMRQLVDTYRTDKLLKNYTQKAFNKPRSNLSIRADCLNNCTIGDVDGAQEVEVIADKINAMRRDNHDKAVIIMVGALPNGTGIADVLNDPRCGWKQGGQNRIYMPASGACAVQKNGGFEISYLEKGKGADFVVVPSLSGPVLAQGAKSKNAPRPML